ncbi:MAG: CopG family ribbon-helix-helix protein [Candidatus Methanomethylophilaceae archaeon]|nr:CopG family ribbon-helix-helix protein [Candidatus Methanomethylophilaceae archaeon]
MGIVSVSLDDESMESLDAIVSAFGLKGRSEAVRLAIRMAVAELKDDDDFNGPVEGVMIIVHEHHCNQWVNLIQHRYNEAIKTQMHSHLKNGKCLELMIISGDGKSIKDMMHEIQSTGEAKYLKFVKS